MSAVLGDCLPSPPDDCITRVLFSRHSNLLIASSWDKTLRLYQTDSRQLLMNTRQQSPVLDVAFPEDGVAYCGLLTGEIRRVGCPTMHEVTMGLHEKGVRCLEWLHSRGLLVSGGWDQMLKLWDPRNPQPLVKAMSAPGRVFALSSSGDRLVVATSGRVVSIYDIRKLEFGEPEQRRESSLKYMTRCVACYPDGRGYALASVEGRVAMELFDTTPEVQAGKYAFKCHRTTDPAGSEVIHPVHTIAYHPLQGTFATGGGDGVVNIWDGANKKRLFQISKYPTSVASLSFSRDGQQLAVGCSYAWEQGERADVPRPEIYMRPVAEAEVRPKARPPPA